MASIMGLIKLPKGMIVEMKLGIDKKMQSKVLIEAELVEQIDKSYIQHYSFLSVHPSVCPLREVSGNVLISRHKRLYIWPSSV